MTASLKPDTGAAGRHLAFLTGEADPTVCLQVFRDAGGGGAEHRHGTLGELLPWLRAAQRGGCGAYVTVNRTDGAGRTRANITEARAAFVDLDGAPLPADWPVEPHLVVETSPGRFHAYWRLAPTGDLDAWSDLQARLAAFFGGDPSVTDPPRVARLAGFWHLKREAFLSRIVAEEDPALVAPLTLDAMADAHPCSYLPPAERGGARSDVPAAGWDSPDAIARARGWLTAAEPAVEGDGGDRRTFATACVLRDLGVSEGEALAMMSELWNPRCLPPWDEDDLATKVGNAYRYASGDAGSNSAEADFTEEPDEPQADVRGVAERGITVGARSGKAADTYANALAAVHRSGLEPAWDELGQRAVFRGAEMPWPEGHGRALDDHVLRLLRLHLADRHQGSDYQPSRDNLLEATMTLAYAAKFNPVAEWLAGLRWDGVRRVERLFPDYFRCGDGAYERAVSRCFMVGAVRRARRPGCKFDTMPILKGPQGWNKSTGFRVLFGDAWFTDAALGNLGEKDAAMLIRGVWFVELAEIDSLRRTEAAVLKAFCSRAVDRLRDPYDRMVKDVPRRCVFGGTVNEGGSLKDSTGNRRFWPLTVSAPIDAAAVARDRDQLWAEAAAMEAAGEADTLPRELWPVAAERQADETSADPWADTIAAFLEERGEAPVRGPDPSDPFAAAPERLPADRVHTSELFDALGIVGARQTRELSQRLRTVMEQSLGWRYSRGVRVGRRTGAGYAHVEHR